MSGRAMLAALIAGERDPEALAQLARGSMRSKTGRLEEAFTGRFTDHHGFLLATMLGRVDQITADIASVQARIDGSSPVGRRSSDRLVARRRRILVECHLATVEVRMLQYCRDQRTGTTDAAPVVVPKRGDQA